MTDPREYTARLERQLVDVTVQLAEMTKQLAAADEARRENAALRGRIGPRSGAPGRTRQ